MNEDELEAVLNAHAFLRVERPPQLWPTAVELESFLRLLGEMIAAGLVKNGGSLEATTLNIANVTVEPDDESSVPAGDFVALTVHCAGDWSPETVWRETSGNRGEPFVTADLQRAALESGAAYGYTRVLAEGYGSLTMFLPRAT